MTRPPPSSDDGSVEPTPEGGSDASVSDAEAIDATDVTLPDAPLVPVSVGVVPVPRAGDDGLVDPIEHTVAHLEVIAAGSRGVTLVRRWDELFSDASQSNDEAWSVLRSAASIYAEAGRSVLVSLAVVDRTLDARPPGLAAAWNGPETRAAVEALIDQTLSSFGDELQLLSIGRELDRWLGAADGSARPAFVAFVTHALGYARNHPSLPAEARVGVTASWGGIVEGSAELTELVEASDVVMATYYPLDSLFSVRPPASAATDLDDLVDALSGDAGAAQVVLQEVGYPSSEHVDSSLEKQQLFFDGLFRILQSRREHFPFVNVYGLNDQPPAACEADAEALGVAGDSRAVAAWCSMGMRDLEGGAKPAWESVTDGLATFTAP